jgi:GTPase SAR1 family protein
MIIVEGPDGSGKSTLVKKLKEWNNLVEIDRGDRDKLGTDPKQTDILWFNLAMATWGGNAPRIADRLYVSELVYGPLWRDENVFEKQDHTIEYIIRGLQIPVIFCLPEYDVVRDNVNNSEHQLDRVSETLRDVYLSYEYQYHRLRRQGVHAVHYDYTDKHVREAKVSTVVKEYIEIHKAGRK